MKKRCLNRAVALLTAVFLNFSASGYCKEVISPRVNLPLGYMPSLSPEDFEANLKAPKAVPFEYVKAAKAMSEYFNSLSEKERVSQIFLVNINDRENYRPVERMDGGDLVPGGYLFFSYNIAESPEKIIGFTQSIEKYCNENRILQPYLAVDQEGGYVNRFRNITSPLPGNTEVAQRMKAEDAYALYSYQSRQLKALGFHMNLAPVAEPLNQNNRSLLEDRSYGSATSSNLFSKICIGAYQSKGISCVAKHFPGNSSTDPHTGLPVISVTQNELEKEYIAPFMDVLKSNPDAILMSHAVFRMESSPLEDLNMDVPACLSQYWVTEKLKDEMKFKGLIISDDIYMGALSKNGWTPEKASVLALNAGVDVIMLTQKQFADAARTLLDISAEDPVLKKNLLRAEKKVIAYKLKCGILQFQQDEGLVVKVVPSCLNSSDVESTGKKLRRLSEFDLAREKGRLIYEKYFQENK